MDNCWFDILSDCVLDPLLDLVLCKFNFSAWWRKTWAAILLGAGTLAFFLILYLGISVKSWVLVLLGAVGMVFFAVQEFRLSLWWFHEGRHGGELPAPEQDMLPKGDMTTACTEEELRRMEPPDVRNGWNNRM